MEYRSTTARMGFTNGVFKAPDPVVPDGKGWVLQNTSSATQDGSIIWTWARVTPDPMQDAELPGQLLLQGLNGS